jgi:hypothetical protein
MAKISSASFKVFLVSGYSMLGAKPKAVTDKTVNVLQNNTHGLGDEWAEHSATGVQRGELSQTGAFFDTGTNLMHEAWSALTNVVRIVTYALAGNIIAKMFIGWQGVYEGSYSVTSIIQALAQADATYAVSGQVDRGLIVQNWTAKTADWNTGNELSLAIVRASTTATVTTTPAHGYAIGSTVIVTIAGATQTEYNGRQTALITGTSTFTFTVSGSPATPATGTITGGVTTDYTLDPTNIAIPITSNTAANPSVVTCPVAHKLTSGDKILISGVVGSSADINGAQTVTVISSTTFSVPVNATSSGGTGGQFVRANSNNGGVGYLSVSDASGFTNFVGTLQHSDDDSSYSTLIAFTDNVTAPFAERKTVTGTVKRYVRFDGNVTGSGSITPFAGFKRNPPA